MSNLPKKHKVISRFEIGFDDETKAEISALKSKIDELTRGLSAKDGSHGDRLLAAMQAEAANDAPQPEFKQLGQWVFEGQDDKYQSAGHDEDGDIYIYACQLKDLITNQDDYYRYWYPSSKVASLFIDRIENRLDWKTQAVARLAINDVDYLSDTPTDDIAPEVPIFSAEGLAAVYPKITSADMQLIFIKNLATTLIQRMHSMDRFSDDDCHIGGQDLQPWDIVFCNYSDFFGVIVGQVCVEMTRPHTSQIISIRKHQQGLSTHITNGETDFSNDSNERSFRTITQDELKSFRQALEACYA